MKRHLLPGLDGFVERGDQFQALAALKPVDQSRPPISETLDDVLIIGLVAEAIDVRWVDRKLFDHLLVRRQLVDEAPVADLVHGKAGDLDRSLLT